ncbi:protein CROC-4 isoform X5 [Pongo abelii]|uniref:protein CROC-4 isoform X5 n=1 Tax=Pongo abelii TaxID=9601 RepID=UPI0023E756A1|nr:protein CROC-4 isoform X6 [Pongo abelii]
MLPPPALSLHLPTVTVSFTRRAARERKREASEIPEWIDRCYVIGAASSTPQEARSWGERGSPAAGATRTVCPPHRSLELGIQEEAASFVFWCHRRWPPMAFGPSSPRPPGSTSHCGISTGCTEWCLCVLPLRTSRVPNVMTPQRHQEPKRRMYFIRLGWIPSDKPSQLTER